MDGEDYLQEPDPCGNEVVEPTGNLTFTYDRRAAAEYGIAHAYRNSYPFEVTNQVYPIWVQSNLQARVTNFINTSINSQTTIVPYAESVPFAAFLHGDVSGNSGQTGSATFNSEALWVGGLPMTHNVSVSGNVIPGLCQQAITSENARTLGWRACPEEYQLYNPVINSTTPPWDDHTNLTRYYSKKNVSGNSHNILGNEDPELDQRGELVAIFYLLPYSEETGLYSWNASPLRPIVTNGDGETLQQGFLGLDSASNQSDFFDMFVTNAEFLDNDGVEDLKNRFNQDPSVTGDLTRIKSGDYITIKSSGGHGFLVVGWGPIVSCPTAVSTIYTLSSAGGQIFADYDSAIAPQSPLSGAVPYVVDFPGTIDRPANAVGVPQLQRPRARPFYCSAHNNPDHFEVSGTSGGFWRFYTFPDSISLQANHLYISPNWEWDNSIKSYSEIIGG